MNEKVINRTFMREGVKTTIMSNRFEILAGPRTEIWEQQAVQMLRQWINERKKNEAQFDRCKLLGVCQIKDACADCPYSHDKA